MTKYEIFDYDVWGNDEEGYSVNDVVPTGITIYTDTSKSSICKNWGLMTHTNLMYIIMRMLSILIMIINHTVNLGRLIEAISYL